MTSLVLLVASLAGTLYAEQPDHHVLTRYIYNLRRGLAQGIWRYDPDSGEFQRLRTLVENNRNPDVGIIRGHTGLAASEDRLILQGAAFMEFDLATGRFLRRYATLDQPTPGWTFQGLMVPESIAGDIGIPPGTYGIPVCLELSCGSLEIPGYEDPAITPVGDRIFRRQLDPADRRLVLAATIEPGAFPRLALDLDHERLLSWKNLSPSDHKLVEMRGSGGALGPEVTLASESLPPDSATAYRVDGITYDPVNQQVYGLLSYIHDCCKFDFARESLALTERVVLKHDDNGTSLSNQGPAQITSVPDRLPSRYVQILPVIADVAGAYGTHFRSDAWIFNPSTESAVFTMRRVARPATSKTVSIPAHGSVSYENILRILGGGTDGDGVPVDALVIDAPYRWGAQLAIYSRTYTVDGSGGSYGQSVPAVPGPVGYSTHMPTFQGNIETSVSDSRFILDTREPGRFRHNLGVVNDTDLPIHVAVQYGPPSLPYPDQGFDQGSDQSFDAIPHSVTQVSIETLFPGDVLEHGVGTILIAADQPAPVWLSMVDNKTGDATFEPYESFSFRASPEDRRVIPGVAATPGANGTRWQTDVYGFFPGVESAAEGGGIVDWKAFLRPASPASCPGFPVETTLHPADMGKGFFVIPDVVRQFAACDSSAGLTGAFEMRVASWMAGLARTYTTRPDGGTYGDMLPFYPERGWPVQHFSGIVIDPRFRINVGLYNGMERVVRYRLSLYGATGELVSESTLELQPHESRQQPVEALFGRSFSAGVYGLTVLPLDEPGSPSGSWAYVSILDNATGDPTNLW